ncbi:MAG: tetratricopeptide repeat protein [Prevotella sp.]|nr:tetratricopeptide repeat protein [Prevotella sp.]
MKLPLQYISTLFFILILLTANCSKVPQRVMPMQSAVDSMKMWYEKKQVDSMKAASQRIADYLDKHQDDRSEAVRKLRMTWLSYQVVKFMAIEGRPDSALVYADRELQELDGMEGVDRQYVLTMANKADCYRQLGKLDQSADCYLQALEKAASTGQEDSTKVALMLGISTAYSFMGDYQSSGIWWKRIGELLGEMDNRDQFIYYNNLGNDHYFQQHYKEAKECFKTAIKLVENDENMRWDYYTSVANLGEIYVCLGVADSARVLIAQADSFFRKVNFPPALYYLETEKIELAVLEGRLDDALHMAEHCEFKDAVIPAGKVLRLKAEEQLMLKIGNCKAAYDRHIQQHILNDSIQNENVRMQMSTHLMQYEHDKRLLEQQATIEHERLTGRLAWALLTVALLAIILLVILIWLRHRRQHVRDMMVHRQIIAMRMENTRNRISPHFIYNALSHEMLAQMDGRKVNLDALTQLLRRGIEQSDMLDTTLYEELQFVDYYVSIEWQQMTKKILYVKEIADDVNIHIVKLPAMTVQIFVENAIKHGLRKKGEHLTIRASRKEQSVLVEVIDDGQGLDTSYHEHTGIKVVRQTIEMLNEHNSQPISFGIENKQSGCRSWLLLPDNFNYKIETV